MSLLQAPRADERARSNAPALRVIHTMWITRSLMMWTTSADLPMRCDAADEVAAQCWRSR
jgi:hypothetical protein